MLNHSYGGLTLPADNSGNLTNLLTFNQAEFFSRDPIYSSMGKSGFIYVPTACRNGDRCRLHIFFHGCTVYRYRKPSSHFSLKFQLLNDSKFSSDKVGNAFIRVTGMMEVAEVNNIIVLFPHTTAVPSYNQGGCWDWYGYLNKWFREYDFLENLRFLAGLDCANRVLQNFDI